MTDGAGFAIRVRWRGCLSVKDGALVIKDGHWLAPDTMSADAQERP